MILFKKRKMGHFSEEWLGLAFATFIISSDVCAQDTLKLYNLPEVEIVNQTKENGSMRKQPSSVSLIDQKQMSNAHITSVKGLSSVVPNLFIPDYGSRLTSAIYIRGIGSRINSPSVGLYVDNMPFLDKSAFDFNFYDIERVDVLRGPQGTLYGQNTMGGLVKVYTRNPLFYQGTTINMGFSTKDNRRVVSATHYHRPSDVFAFSAGGYYEGKDGFFKNDMTGNRVDDMQAAGGRLRCLWLPSSRLQIDMNVGYDYSDEGAYPYFYTGSLTSTEYYPDAIGKITNNHNNGYYRSMLTAGMNIGYSFEGYKLNSVTGYQFLHDRMFLDQDFIYPDIYTLEQKQRIHSLSEELTLSSTKSKFWEWVSGLSISNQSLHTNAPVTFCPGGVEWLCNTINSHMPDLSAKRMSMGVSINDESLAMGGVFETPTFNFALFHQTTLHLTKNFSAYVGGRLNYCNQSMDFNAPGVINYDFVMNSQMMPISLKNLCASPIYVGHTKDDYLSFLPKFSLKYEFNSNNCVYAAVSKGVRSGGYNIQMFSDLLQNAMSNEMMQQIKDGTMDNLAQLAQRGMPQTVISMIGGYLDLMPMGESPVAQRVTYYKPEYSWNYEVGAHLNNASKTLQCDASLFYIRTYDQQIARFADSGLGRRMVNAGRSRSCGAELSGRFMPNKHWNFGLNYGYTNAKFKDYEAGDGYDYSDNYVPFAPQHTLRADAAYTWRMKSGMWLRSATLGADYQGAGRVYWTEINDRYQDFYSLLGARLTFEIPYATVQLWGKNLTGCKYNTFFFESASRGFEQHGKPMQFGVDVKFVL